MCEMPLFLVIIANYDLISSHNINDGIACIDSTNANCTKCDSD